LRPRSLEFVIRPHFVTATQAVRQAMRIILVAPGIEDYCIAFANALAASADVMLIAPRAFFKDRIVPRGPRIQVLQVDWPRHRSLRNVVFLVRLFGAIHRYQSDLVHFLSEKNVWLNLLLPFLRRLPIVTTVHDVQYHPGDAFFGFGSVPQWCTRLFIWQSKAIIVHGQSLRQRAIKRFRVKESAIYIIPHLAMPFYRDLASREPARGGAPMVLFFGRIRRYKGIAVLISAAQRVVAQMPNVRFVIAGQSDREAKHLLAQAASFCDVRDRYISVIEAAQLFQDAKLLALPYTEASQSGVLAVANTFGLPAVATDVGEMGATVSESRTGLVVPASNPEAFAEAILSLLRDETLYARLAKNGRKLAETELSSAAIGAKAVAIYDQVLNSARNWQSPENYSEPLSQTRKSPASMLEPREPAREQEREVNEQPS
jgi:glycosyltransferase involved in cell wall biosynthesis